MLDVGDGHDIYWETCGNPSAEPAVVLHGGPGSGCIPGHRRFFSPDRYRIVLFDQRGSGRSTPSAADASTELTHNTTDHLLADLEQLRQHLGVDRWLVFGHSWGTTLGLAYAETHPQRVSALVLAAVCTTRRSEIDWLYHGVGRFLPEQWERFRDAVPPADRDGDLVGAYCRLLQDCDLAVREAAAASWCAWEDAVVSSSSGAGPDPRYRDPAFRMAFARIVTHYFTNDAWLDDGALLRNASRLHGLPGVLIHGRLDLGSPLATAWALAQAWPDSELVVLDAAGHSAGTDMADAIVAATDRFASASG
jgi:proline iminopeptidase